MSNTPPDRDDTTSTGEATIRNTKEIGHDVADKVREWLLKTGATLEMSVAQVLLRNGLGVQQGQYYVDPDEPGKNREIDVINSQGLSFAENALLELTAVFECKYATQPWVLYRTPPHYSTSDPHFDRVSSDLGRLWLDQAKIDDRFRDVPLFQREPRPGYALAQSLLGAKGKDVPENRVDPAYKALQGAVKASTWLATTMSQQEPLRRVTVVLPAIVIRGQLFETWLGDKDLVVREIDRGQVHLSVPANPDGRVLVDIVTEPAFEAFVHELKQAAELMHSVGKRYADRVLQDPSRLGLG